MVSTAFAPPPAQSVALRHLHSHDDYAACVELQKLTWGESFREVVPAAIVKIGQRVGGIAAGAFDSDGGMVGFVFGLTGYENGHPLHWSHMLAVRPELRDQGIGRLLKEFQRATLAAAGVDTICWTYDPLVARNAHLNLNRLGVSLLEYVPDMYAPTGSDLHAIGTDRLVVCWNTTSLAPGRSALTDAGRIVNERGSTPVVWPTDEQIGIEIPSDVSALQERSLAEAMRWRLATRAAFLHYLAAGYGVIGLAQTADGRPYYLLRRS